jgi:hypothetical protein
MCVGTRERQKELSIMVDTLTRLADKSEIQEALLRYCRGVDRRDWDLVRAAFFEDCVDDHAEFKGKRDDFVAWLSERHSTPGFVKSTHVLGNCLIEFASDNVAIVETYFVAKLVLAPDAGGHRKMLLDAKNAESAQDISVEVLGRYVDRFEKRQGAWRIARRCTVFDSMQSKPVAAPTVPSRRIGWWGAGISTIRYSSSALKPA